MKCRSRQRGFTFLELLAVVAIIGMLIGLLLPAINAAREAGRRASCTNHLYQLGLALNGYCGAFERYPPSARLVGAGATKTVGGWSFLVRLLPYLERNSMYEGIDMNDDPDKTTSPTALTACDTEIKEFVCPSNGQPLFRNSTASGYRPPSSRLPAVTIADPETGETTYIFSTPGAPSPDGPAVPGSPPMPGGRMPVALSSPSTMMWALTNYKGLGASTKASLQLVTTPGAGNPPYGSREMHPDGVMFPGDGVRPRKITDGLSHTLIMIETIDTAASRWTVGKEVTLSGLQNLAGPQGATPANPQLGYFTPSGKGETLLGYPASSGWTSSSPPSSVNYAVDGDPGWSSPSPVLGPASSHPGGLNSLTCDGNVKFLPLAIDTATFFYLITKANDDPYLLP